MLTDSIFRDLVGSASLAPSADNMQPWEFGKNNDAVEVFSSDRRKLPTDIIDMFTWVSIGAAIQNIVVEAAARGLKADIEYLSTVESDQPAAVIRFSRGIADGYLAEWIPFRATNRSNYERLCLPAEAIYGLTQSIAGIDAGLHWTTEPSGFRTMASMDANSSFIRLEHKPFHDELFEILRFSRKEIKETRFGLDYESLGVPAVAVFLARQLQHWSVNKLVSKSGAGRLVAKMLSMKLLNSAALCLVTAKSRDKEGYMEAGRAMEQLWLEATSMGLSVHPYGALPQYLTRAELEPGSFLPRHLSIIRSHANPFYSIFPGAEKEHPAIVLRIGEASNASARSDVRLGTQEITRNN